MTRRFFSIHVPIFGSVAMVLLCTVFFLLPFALRGARLGLNDMQNNVADWLPKDYVETKELAEFRKYFYGGDQFVCVSGPWCKEGDPRYTNLLRKLREESLEYETVLKEAQLEEELAAHRVGDELGLMFAGNYHEDWGENREKWLKGRNGQWYFIKRDGNLYKWKGQNNVVEGADRARERALKGKNEAIGTFVRKFGAPPDDAKGIPNAFYERPEKLFCRPFQSVISGPDVFEQMAGPNGTLRIGAFGEDDKSTFEAKIEAHKRLTGALFGPTPAETFTWTFESLLRHVDDTMQTQLRSSPAHQQVFDEFVSSEVNEEFDGDINGLRNAKQSDQLEIWYKLWYQLQLEPPPRQTCLIVTLNEPIIHELSRAVGRPLMGKSRGRILELATGECGIEAENLRIGGPPSDNVAIDEEGTSTLMRLVSLSLIIGLTLAYLSFGSVRVALMLFFVGGVAAISSLSYVWFAGFTMDAILMTMPSLVYVLALSSAVHIVNYYRDACYEDGPDLAVEKAVKHSWFPCTLAAFTTALGLISLTTSSLTPIFKFGLFSAIATMATVVLLFTYLPSALTVWKPGYQKRDPDAPKESNLSAAVGRFWARIGDWVIGHHGLVTVSAVVLLVFFAVGVTQIQTSVHLLKLFDKDAKILHDYRWMEANLGKLVPAEIPIGIDKSAQQEPFEAAALAKIHARELAKHPEGTSIEKAMEGVTPEYDDEYLMAYDLKYSMLERIELSRRVRQQLERHFGPDGMGIVGSGMSMDVFAPLYRIQSNDDLFKRKTYNSQLVRNRGKMLEQEYMAELGHSNLDREDREADLADPQRAGRELWRVSIRLAALNDVDYGQFVNDLKAVVEPVLTAYRYRTEVLKSLQSKLHAESLGSSSVLVLGRNPELHNDNIKQQVAAGAPMSEIIDQTFIFSETFKSILENRGFRDRTKAKSAKFYSWIDPDEKGDTLTAEWVAEHTKLFDCVVIIEDDPLFNMKMISNNTDHLVDCRDHKFLVDPDTKQPLPGMLTAKERKSTDEDDIAITAMYTGIIPIVYKAQRSLLQSLIESIGLAFVMISFVMMLLLRNWRSPAGPSNLLNVRGGMISMIPNIFPIVIVFGCMGHLNRWYSGSVDVFLVDIGSMMTASVAMGVAVDDTIHFLNWYRTALDQGHRRVEAIKVAYSRVATAMTQTTLIGGLGLSAFALSTFTPTQRFGVLMLILLAMALIGDLIVLPALLAGPLGKYFGKERPLDELAEAALDAEVAFAGGGMVQPEPSLRLIGEEDSPEPKPEIILPPGTDLSKNIRRLE